MYRTVKEGLNYIVIHNNQRKNEKEKVRRIELHSKIEGFRKRVTVMNSRSRMPYESVHPVQIRT